MVIKEDDMLKEVQKIQLNILIEFDRICKKHNLTYQLFSGTLLGAIRHSGVIPWDDDLDIGMLRSEYDKFIKVCEKELRDEYFLQTWESDLGFALPIAKIIKNGTKFIEKILLMQACITAYISMFFLLIMSQRGASNSLFKIEVRIY